MAAHLQENDHPRREKLAGAILVGDTETYDDLVAKMRSQDAVPARRADLLFGVPASGEAEFSFAAMADDKQVCDCNGVCKGKIVETIKAGKTTMLSVGKATRAGTGCGSCKKIIKGLIESIAGELKTDPSEAYYVPAIPMDKPMLAAEVKRRGLKAVSQVMEALATKEDEKSKMGLAILLRALWGKEYIDERDCRFVNDRLHGNIQKDGTFSVIPRIYGGVTTADELVKIGMVAKKYNVPTVKLTGGQRIDLLGIKKEDLPAIWKDLDMVSGYAYTKAFRTCKTCVGSDWCRFGTNDSTKLGIAIEKKFQGLETPAKVKMAVSGCPLQLCGIDDQGCRDHRDRGRRMGKFLRGRGIGRERAEGGGDPLPGEVAGRGDPDDGAVHAVLPGSCAVFGADVRFCASHRAGEVGGSCSSRMRRGFVRRFG